MKVIKYKKLLNPSEKNEQQRFMEIERVCREEVLQDNEEIAKREAWNGAYTIAETEGQPTVLTLEERVCLLEKASAAEPYTAGTWYYRGNKVSYEEKKYICIAPDGTVCVWSPEEYPAYWKEL